MAIQPIPTRPDHRPRLAPIPSTRPRRRPTVYTSPARAARTLRRLIIAAIITAAAALALTFGYELLEFLGRAVMVLLLAGVTTLAIALAIHEIRELRR